MMRNFWPQIQILAPKTPLRVTQESNPLPSPYSARAAPTAIKNVAELSAQAARSW